MSSVHIYLGASGKRPMEEEFDRAKEYAQKAIQSDNRAAESHEALANIYIFHDWNWDEAFRSLDKAIELNPGYAGAYLTKAILLAIHENYHEAIETAKKFIQLDPFYPPGIFAYASILLFADRLQECTDQLDKPDEMFQFLSESVERKDHSVVNILGYPSFRKYRSDPRLARLIKKIGLWK